MQRMLCVAGASHGLVGLSVAAATPANDAPVLRRLRFVWTLSNPLNRELQAQRVWSYLPAHTPSGQRLVGVRCSAPYRVLEDALGHRILEWSFERFPALSQQVVSLTVEVALDAPPAREVIEPNPWLAAERFIESQDPQIQTLAGELRRATPTETARAIYDWVRTNLTYAGYVADDLGAAYAAQNRRGDCTEYADLVVALARANGIAARQVGGYVADRDLAPRPQDYHNWAEVFLNGVWCVVDAQKEKWQPLPHDYIAFRFYRDVATNPMGLAHRYRVDGDLRVSF